MSERLEFEVSRAEHGRTLEVFLGEQLRNYTPWRIQRMIRHGFVFVDGQPVDVRYRLFERQIVTVKLIDPPDKLYEPEPGPLSILYEDAWIIVIDKAAGIVVHPVGQRQTGTLANRLQAHFDGQTICRGLLRPGFVHRLDRQTSGVIAVAKTFAAHRDLRRQFELGQVKKSYLSVVEGELLRSLTKIDAPIGRHPSGTTLLMSCAADAISPRPALTRVKVVESDGKRTLVLCRPETGRNHQLRVHLASVGHPIVGDEYYLPHGEIRERRKETETNRAERHLLHARSLRFRHPITAAPMCLRAAVPSEFSL
ncbi:RluA family pseudouridine synthase [Calycomorphotria hydatis]|uniref:Pseudouridine synthase n=1 Tax=Calycomorphotria hydatis TaxID=2528027 RepID=A0A517TAP6_9PLAN|nr:RluA family pseudouridine synthase [Calycomorphotria hydatis]QDT65447.1 Ribosomal large subunit pseudouridine synthase D [Calycomorphotria hydatis]